MAETQKNKKQKQKQKNRWKKGVNVFKNDSN